MRLEPEIFCAYIDHKSVPPCDLARLLQTHEGKNLYSGINEARLATCQRFEIYTHSENMKFPVDVFGSLTRHVNILAGSYNILRRLSSVASGAESLLLGERFIPEQVSRAFRHVTAGGLLNHLSAQAILISNDVRTQYNFFAPTDYGGMERSFFI